MGPLKAARIDMKFPTSTLALLMPHLIPNSRTQRQWQVSKATLFSSEVGRPMSAGPSRNDFSCAWWLKSAFRRWATAGNVKLLLPPRQSRGASLGRLDVRLIVIQGLLDDPHGVIGKRLLGGTRCSGVEIKKARRGAPRHSFQRSIVARGSNRPGRPRASASAAAPRR